MKARHLIQVERFPSAVLSLAPWVLLAIDNHDANIVQLYQYLKIKTILKIQ